MGQVEILNVLSKARRPLSVKEISSTLNKREQHVLQTIRKLIKRKEVLFLEIDSQKAKEIYNSCKRVRLYFTLEGQWL